MSTVMRGGTDTFTTEERTTLGLTATGGANAAVTATLPGVAGQFHHITSISIQRAAAGALAGTAALEITSTNLPGSLAWSVGNAMAAGGSVTDVRYEPAVPLRSSAVNVATTIVCPAPGLGVIWRVTVTYYTAA